MAVPVIDRKLVLRELITAVNDAVGAEIPVLGPSEPDPVPAGVSRWLRVMRPDFEQGGRAMSDGGTAQAAATVTIGVHVDMATTDDLSGGGSQGALDAAMSLAVLALSGLCIEDVLTTHHVQIIDFPESVADDSPDEEPAFAAGAVSATALVQRVTGSSLIT